MRGPTGIGVTLLACFYLENVYQILVCLLGLKGASTTEVILRQCIRFPGRSCCYTGLTMHFTQVIGGEYLHERMCIRTPT